MEGSAIDVVVFAPLAPIFGVLLFWFIQLLFIESEKYLIEQIRSKHGPLCRFTNFLGIFFQSICHALGYTVTKSGISEFILSVNYGKVAPKKERKGVFEWVANVFLFIGPFFIPAFILLVCLLILISKGFGIISAPSLTYTFGGQIITFGTSLHYFSVNFFGFLGNIDLFHPGHFGFLLLMIFLGMGIRPSYIGEEKPERIDIFYDLKNILNLILHKPLYLIILFFFAYLFFHLSRFLNLELYVGLFIVFGWLSIISIVSIIISDMIMIFIRTTDEIPGSWRLIPFIILPSTYILLRILFYYVSTEYGLSISLLGMILITSIITYLLLKSKSDRFKTERDIKSLKKKAKVEKNG